MKKKNQTKIKKNILLWKYCKNHVLWNLWVNKNCNPSDALLSNRDTQRSKYCNQNNNFCLFSLRFRPIFTWFFVSGDISIFKCRAKIHISQFRSIDSIYSSQLYTLKLYFSFKKIRQLDGCTFRHNSKNFSSDRKIRLFDTTFNERLSGQYDAFLNINQQRLTKNAGEMLASQTS